MRFSLFSKIDFEVADPVALVEYYCFQTDFFANYDLLPSREVEDVNEIGARIPVELLPRCREVIQGTKSVRIFAFDLDAFLDLNDKAISDYVQEVSRVVIDKLTGIKGIGLSKATKVLHTVYPHIIPMVDSMLRDEYRREIDPRWREGNPRSLSE